MKISRLLLCSLLFICSFLHANHVSIYGKITDNETGIAISNATICVLNTVLGTTSGANGEFCLSGEIADSATLIFSSIGYQTKKICFVEKSNDFLLIALNPELVSLDEVVISSTKNELTSFDQTTPISVVTEASIVENQVQDISNIITNQPAVSLAGAGFHRAPSIRGLARKRVVVLVDGERISSERNPGPPGTFVNPLDVKNIEILRGPYSTLYGSDAVGGVINIVTKDYKQPLSNNYVGGAFSSNYQSIRNGYNVNLIVNTQLSDKLFFHLTTGKRKAESYKDAEGNSVMSTNFSEQSATAKITWQINAHHKLQLNGILSKADSIGKPAYSEQLNALHPIDNHYKVGLNYNWLTHFSWMPKMVIKASAHKHEITARIYNYQNIEYGRVVNKSKNLYNTDYVYQHDFNFVINPKIDLLAGLDFYQRGGIHIDEHVRAFLYEPDNPNFYLGDLVYDGPLDTTIENSYQRSVGFFVQANYDLSPKLLLNGGVRWNTFKTNAHLVTTTTEGPPYDYSKNSYETKTSSDQAFSGNFGISYRPKGYINITGNIGQAFRVPSIKELFVNTMTPGGMNFCNPDLVPEKSFNLDFGVKFHSQKQSSISFALFRNEIDNMIILAWDSLHATGQFQNRNALIYGGEIAFDFRLAKPLFISGNMSYVKGTDDSDEVLIDIPPFQLNLETKYYIKPEKLFVALKSKYNAEQSKFAVGDVPTDAFVVVDFLSGWQINTYLKLTFSVTNIFNNYYREHYQFDWVHQPGRSFNAGIQINF